MDGKNQAGSSSNKQKGWFELDDEHNTHVYVTGLPTDITEEDFIDLMKRKCGIIKKKPDNSYNIKLYKNKHDGSLKGDAVCCFAHVASVDLALTLIDGYQYDDKHVLHCERAKYEMTGSYDESRKRPRMNDKKSKLKQKKKLEKLLSWDEKPVVEVKQKKVILKHMFSPDEISQNAELLLEIKEDVEEICNAKLSCEPKSVVIHDKHQDGVVAVTFAEFSQAENCVKALNHQKYGGRIVTAELWDGKSKYKVKETDEEEQVRVQKWHEDIQKSDDEGEEVVKPETRSDSPENQISTDQDLKESDGNSNLDESNIPGS